jgi:drug/metabolite transporter (DMT)-like permease
MVELWGVLAAMLAHALGGSAIGVTRYVVGAIDPLTLGALRFGTGFIFLLPVALLLGGKWPGRCDWPAVAGLGVLFFGIFPLAMNVSLIFTTATRGALAVSTLPLLSMAVGALLGVERLTARKTVGVFIAVLGVTIALLTGLASAPPGAWRGDLMMIGGALCLAFYNVLSRPFIRRSGPIPFTTMGMGVGTFCLATVAWMRGGFETVFEFGTTQWAAIVYLGTLGGAVTFVLWALALIWTSPTRVVISVPINPITASLVGAILLNEPIGLNLIIGLITVFMGIWIATTTSRICPLAPSMIQGRGVRLAREQSRLVAIFAAGVVACSHAAYEQIYYSSLMPPHLETLD